jgi:hypothetical protein
MYTDFTPDRGLRETYILHRPGRRRAGLRQKAGIGSDIGKFLLKYRRFRLQESLT